MKANAHKNFFIVTALMLMLFLCLTAAFNAVVDPLYVFNIATIKGVNGQRFLVKDYLRTSLAYRVRRTRPGGIVLGSSRVMRRAFCEHGSWHGDAAPCLDMPVFLSTAYEIERYFEHAHALRPVRWVVWGLDFFAFNNRRDSSMPGFSEDRLAARPNGRPAPYPVKDMFSLLISSDAARASFQTILNQNAPRRLNIMSDLNPIFDDHTPKIPREAFNRDEFFGQAIGIVTSGYLVRPECDFMLGDETSSRMLRSYKKLLDTAVRDHIDVQLFIPPVHAYLEETKFYLGVWNEYEQWKRVITSLAADAREKGGRVTLWDFSGYNAITTEAVPPPGAKTPMLYYEDANHFTNTVATMIMDVMTSTRTTGAAAPTDFGAALTPENIDARLKHTRVLRGKYTNAHRAELATFKKALIGSLEKTLTGACRKDWRRNIDKY